MRRINSYGDFILENMDLAKSIVGKKMKDFEKLKTLLSSNLGYMGKFTEYLFSGTPYNELETVFSRIKTLKSDNTNININNDNFEELLDKVQLETENIKIKRVVNQFPKKQKELAKKLIDFDPDTIRNILIKLSEKGDLTAFTSKISRYKTDDKLYSAMKVFIKDIKNDRESMYWIKFPN